MFTTLRYMEMELVLLSSQGRKTWNTPSRTLITPNSDHMRERRPTLRLLKTTVVEAPRDLDPAHLADPAHDLEDDLTVALQREVDLTAGANHPPKRAGIRMSENTPP